MGTRQGPLLDGGGPAESWGMSWEYNSLIHMREDRGLDSQMVAAWVRTDIWIIDVMGAESSRAVDW